MNIFKLLLLLVLLNGCSSIQKNHISDWALKVKTHHQQTEGGELLLEAMASHGGLENWLQSGVIHFRWTYHMNDRGPNAKVDSFQDVDILTLKSVHNTSDNKIKFGWDGRDAWISPPESEFSPPPRFWALTPYYFVAIPFVFADLGAKAELLRDKIEFEGRNWLQVKITYSKESGDAPDDYYILLIDPNNKRVGGARYIVTSKLVAKNGPLPEKLITLEKYKKINGLIFPTKHRTFKMNQGKVGLHIRDADVSALELKPRESVNFEIPDGAKRL